MGSWISRNYSVPEILFQSAVCPVGDVQMSKPRTLKQVARPLHRIERLDLLGKCQKNVQPVEGVKLRKHSTGLGFQIVCMLCVYIFRLCVSCPRYIQIGGQETDRFDLLDGPRLLELVLEHREDLLVVPRLVPLINQPALFRLQSCALLRLQSCGAGFSFCGV